jgi:L-ascorbate metabolism protein UlaG (beta-lactamase superfamily)
LKITKRGHACLEVEVAGERLIIDPGSYTDSLVEHIGALVITHQHDDHCSPDQVAALLAINPGLKIFGTAEVAARLGEFEVTVVYHGDHHEVGPFALDFFGDQHQLIHESIAIIQNTGVLVNSKLYYPGDSYTPSEYPFEVLACPSSAPWLKIGDVIDYLNLVRPQKCFPTHNALLSELGQGLQNSRIQQVTEAHGGEFRYLKVGESWQL